MKKMWLVLLLILAVAVSCFCTYTKSDAQPKGKVSPLTKAGSKPWVSGRTNSRLKNK